MAAEREAMTTKELTETVRVLLEQEEGRALRARRRELKRKRKRRADLEFGIVKLAKSVELIKWCVVSITTILVVFMLVIVFVVVSVQREAERIKGEVQAIQRQAEMIRDKIRNPLESIGGSLGRKLDENIGEALGIERDKK